jgi:hypothetical protein
MRVRVSTVAGLALALAIVAALPPSCRSEIFSAGGAGGAVLDSSDSWEVCPIGSSPFGERRDLESTRSAVTLPPPHLRMILLSPMPAPGQTSAATLGSSAGGGAGRFQVAVDQTSTLSDILCG